MGPPAVAAVAFLLFSAPMSAQVEATASTRCTLHGTPQEYTVRPGDTLYGIARAHGLAFPAVARANRVEDPNRVRAGRTITLPTQLIVPLGVSDGVVVNIPEGRLYHFGAGKLLSVYPAAVGLPTWQTPLGRFTVTVKVPNPTWYMPEELAAREKVRREVIPPGEDNPLGDRWIGTSLAHTGIHSTNVPMTVGRPVSHGCVRLYPEQAHALFDAVVVGEAGEIVYAPVKACLNDSDIVVEVHPDIYGRMPDLAREAERVIANLGVRNGVDADRLATALAECRGLPTVVGQVE